MKPEAQPCHRQDSQQHKDALGRTAPKGDGADSEFSPEGFPGSLPHVGQVNHPTASENAAATHCGAGSEAWCGSSMGDAGWDVCEPSFVT